MKTCTVCGQKHYAKGLCKKHYKRFIQYGRIGLLPKSQCKVSGCKGKYQGLGYCIKHYAQFKTHGKLNDNLLYNQFDPNEFIFKGRICKVVLRDQQGNFKAESLIDIEDYEKIKNFKWYLSSPGYCFSDKLQRNIGHLVLNHKPNNTVLLDHKNRDKLDNRKGNLRLCSKSQNIINSKIGTNNTSGVKGVSWMSDRNKWQAYIQSNKSRVLLGRFDRLSDAVKARKTAEKTYYGNFRYDR